MAQSYCKPNLSLQIQEVKPKDESAKDSKDSIDGFMRAVTPTGRLWSGHTLLDYKMSTAQCCSTTYFCACSSY